GWGGGGGGGGPGGYGRGEGRRRRGGDHTRWCPRARAGRRSAYRRFRPRHVKRTANAFGGLDFVWNHAGHPGPAAIEGLDMADFELAMDLNLRSVMVTTEAALP